MRRTVLLLGPLVAAGALFACENDSSSGGPGTFTVEAGTFDAPASDSPAPDADPPKTGGVTVSVTRTGLPAAGISVVFHDAAGAVLQVVTTGADGKATSTGALPAMASALLKSSGAATSRKVVTWVDVKAGDVLSTVDFPDPTVIGQYNVSFGSFADGGALFYTAGAGVCGGSGDSPIAIPLSRRCLNATNPVLGVALDAVGPIAMAYKKGNAAPSDGGVGEVTLGPWLTPSTLTVSVTNAPAGTIDALVGEYSEGATYLSRTRSFVGGVTTLSFAPGFAEALEPAVLEATGGGVRGLIKRITPGPNVTFDFATVLPAILTATIDKSNVKRPVIGWTTDAPLSGSDGGHVTLLWGGEGIDGAWTFIVPPSATSVKTPELPAEATAWLPLANSNTGNNGQVIFADVDSVPSYDAFRSGAGRVDVGSQLFAGELLSQNGTLRTTIITLPLD